ncbi:MAG: ROK family protein, partial [Verrucomicrobia bacterium]|nr:ROK family protein [Verrucomicrobiota bacterium]
MEIDVKIKPELDPAFIPAALWNQAYRRAVAASDTRLDVAIALLRPDGGCSVYETQVLPPGKANDAITLRYVERMLKFLFWQRGANKVLLSGCDRLAARLAAIYSASGERRFDFEFFGQKVYDGSLDMAACSPTEIPEPNEHTLSLGRHLDGCRIGFDLGGSDRKCAAVIDGEVVFSEEVEWNPYFEKDPAYHLAGIQDTIQRAAAHLPRVDAIGGSAAGVYVNNEVRVASLFRGIPPTLFDSHVRRIFYEAMAPWGDVPFVVVNDGEVTALAGSMAMDANAVLGLSMGTSTA